ncbi:MAG: DUF4421 domain-containing protein [Bacteroidales bacterium]|nr:DUF4421 domain-containing protein [Bacteroidales bacterium]
MRRITHTILAAFLIIQTASAQNQKNGIGHWTINHIVSEKITTDTEFVIKPKTKFMAKVESNSFGSSLEVSANDINAEISALTKQNFGINFSWRGIGVGYSFAPKYMVESKANKEWDFDYYGQKIGGHFEYQDIRDFEGSINKNGDKESTINIHNAMMKTLIIDVFWVFNNKKFSIPAVFNQSMIQRKSAGGWLASAMFCNRKFSSDINDEYGLFKSMKDSKKSFLAIGGGYGYNFVSKNQKWLIHGSALPYISIWKDVVYDGLANSQTSTTTSTPSQVAGLGNTSTTTTTSSSTTSNSNSGFGLDPEFFMNVKLGLSYSFRRSYFGLSGYIQYDIMNQEELEVTYTKYQINLFYGIRFGGNR